MCPRAIWKKRSGSGARRRRAVYRRRSAGRLWQNRRAGGAILSSQHRSARYRDPRQTDGRRAPHFRGSCAWRIASTTIGATRCISTRFGGNPVSCAVADGRTSTSLTMSELVENAANTGWRLCHSTGFRELQARHEHDRRRPRSRACSFGLDLVTVTAKRKQPAPDQ